MVRCPILYLKKLIEWNVWSLINHIRSMLRIYVPNCKKLIPFPSRTKVVAMNSRSIKFNLIECTINNVYPYMIVSSRNCLRLRQQIKIYEL